MSDVVIRAEGLGKRYRITGPRARYRTLREEFTGLLLSPVRRLARAFGRLPEEEVVWALKGVSFEVKRGEVLGIIGPNGAGKTTLLRVLSRITDPTEGTAEVRGRVGSLLEIGTGFHPELTGRENIYLAGAILGMRRREIGRKFDEIVEFSGVGRFLDTPLKRYSSGMQVRLGFAVAAHLETEILLVDEVLAVGDAAFQKRCLGKMGEVTQEGRTVLFVSHNMAAITGLCDSAIWINEGKIAAAASSRETASLYLSEMYREQSCPTANRRDRQGAGWMRIEEARVYGADYEGQPVSVGQDTVVEIAYGSQREQRIEDAKIGITICDANENPITFMRSDYSREGLTVLPPGGLVRCHMPRLQLMPGEYSITIGIVQGNKLIDRLQNAARFRVLEGDYYGTGRMPPYGYGPLVIDYKWSVVAKGKEEND